MRRPWTWLLLLAFLTAQIYGLHRVVARHPRAVPIAKITNLAGGLLTRGGQTYLVSPAGVYALSGPSAHIRLSAAAATWEDLPQPSGAGMWRILVGTGGRVLMGLHGLVYGSPVGSQAVLVDPGTRIPLVAATLKSPPAVLSNYTVDRIVWSTVSPLAVFLGTGPRGTGFYSVSDTGTVSYLYPVTSAAIATFGDDGTNLSAVTTSGAIIYREQVLQAMPEAPAWTMPDGTILGWTKNEAIWWRDGNLAGTVRAPVPNTRPVVQPGHLRAAYLIGAHKDQRLVVLTGKRMVTLPFAYNDAHVLGWYHQAVLIAVTSGPDAGIYRVLVSTALSTSKKHGAHRV
jgi:hypothetical protein